MLHDLERASAIYKLESMRQRPSVIQIVPCTCWPSIRPLLFHARLGCMYGSDDVMIVSAMLVALPLHFWDRSSCLMKQIISKKKGEKEERRRKEEEDYFF